MRPSASLLSNHNPIALWCVAILIVALLWLGLQCVSPLVAHAVVAKATATAGALSLPSVNISLGGGAGGGGPQDLSKGLQILILLTVLTLAPSIFILTTCFTRIVIVLSLVRQAIGTPSLPPTQVLVGLALILTFFVMSPTFNKVNSMALQPYLAGKITQPVAMEKAMDPMRVFMFKQAEPKDIELFMGLAQLKRPTTTKEVPTHVLLPAFVIGEIKTAFQMGFVIFLPFLIIDVVVSSILVSMGMLFLPPASIALPFKLILFVLVDGWHLICQSLVLGFR
jgi:flagellar biosynthesis protein FliP